MFRNRPEIIFTLYLLNDLCLIIDITNISCTKSYPDSHFKHDYLKFTYKTSEKEINFLDLKVCLNDNVIETQMYKKPINLSINVYCMIQITLVTCKNPCPTLQALE